MTPRRILVPTDFSCRSLGALRYAREVARAFGGGIHLLPVLPHPVGWSPKMAEGALAAIHQQSYAGAELGLIALATDEWLDPATTTAVVSGDVDHAILSYAEAAGADLIVMGTHGYTAIARFLLGSVAERVVRRASCPVVIVPHRPMAAGVGLDATGVQPRPAAA